MKKNKTYITQPFLPPLEEFQDYLKVIWDKKWLTNNGEFHQQFEKELAKYLNVPYVSLFTNGTLALVTALQALNIKGEVITTPYTFIATSHALVWNNIKPIFVDVEPIYGNLDPNKIERAITDKTTAILPVHVYGNPCDTEKIQKIADKYNLKVIYDAAHTFGVKQNNISILNKGDLSVLSFHATKVFNTFEGGAIISHSSDMKHHIDNLKNFGFRGEITVEEVGINGKMSEFNAALGLLQLKYINYAIEKRKQVAVIYYKKLSNINGLRLITHRENTKWNYAYFPIFVDESEYPMSRDQLYEKLKRNNIFGRRYFYPLISEFPMYKDLPSAEPTNLQVAHKMSRQVICLPIYPDLKEKEIEYICNLIIENE